MQTHSPTDHINAQWAFERYELIRHTLPNANFPKTSRWVGGLMALAPHFDIFLLDAFGVLNVGQTAIKSAPKAVAALQAAGKRVMVLTNGASHTAAEAQIKFQTLGFNFSLDNIVASRDALCEALTESFPESQDLPMWGMMALPGAQLVKVPINIKVLGHRIDLFNQVSGFILLSAASWSPQQQRLLIQSLRQNPRPVWVGNPDLVAPREEDLSLEPGYFAHQLSQIPGVSLRFFGKPFANIYQLAFARLKTISKQRVLMVGDTLHTDILGGAAYGLQTALVTGHGVFAQQDVRPYVRQSGIIPDYIMRSP